MEEVDITLIIVANISLLSTIFQLVFQPCLTLCIIGLLEHFQTLWASTKVEECYISSESWSEVLHLPLAPAKRLLTCYLNILLMDYDSSWQDNSNLLIMYLIFQSFINFFMFDVSLTLIISIKKATWYLFMHSIQLIFILLFKSSNFKPKK